MLAVALGVRQQPAPQKAQEPAQAVAQEQQNVQDQKPAEQKVEANAAQAGTVEKPAEQKKEPEAPASWLDKITQPEATQEKKAWDDNSKNLFKEFFGHEDPVAYKEKVDTELEAYNLAKPEIEQARALKSVIDSLPAAMQEAISLYRDGKDWSGYLASLPKEVVADRPVKEIPKLDLVDRYFKGKVTQEQRDKLSDPDIDPAIKDAINAVIDTLYPTAVDMYNADLEKPKVAARQRQEQIRAAEENHEKSVAINVATAKKSLIGPLVDQSAIDRFKSNELVRDFLFKSDGVTYNDDLFEKIMFANDRTAVYERLKTSPAVARGEGMAAATDRLPSGTTATGRATAPAKTEEIPADQRILQRIMRGR